MEDSNPISGDEIDYDAVYGNDLTNLEDTVRHFKIVVAGDGDIQGGFGRLPISADPFERLANIENAIDQFQLSGNNVGVAGSLDNGFVVS